MVIELIGTWVIVGFFSAVGWNLADKTVNKPHIDPWLEKTMATEKKPEAPAVEINNSIKKDTP
jgi:hypothetical protein